MKYLLLSIILFPLFSLAQSDIDKQYLDTINISGYARQTTHSVFPKTIHIIHIEQSQLQAIESIDDLLKLIPGIDIRTRGSKGVQSDISIRGGNFDQVLILLNGIPVQNPQTGHHALDLPVDFSMLDHIEILEGASAYSYGINAYSGAINLITKNTEQQEGTSRLSSGQYGYMKLDLDLSHRLDKISIYNGLTYQKSNGYLTNDSINNTDFNTIKDFVHLRYHGKIPMDLQAGYHLKDFGAHSFYTSRFPWQYEKTHGYYASLQSRFGKKIQFQPSLAFRLHYDEFQLFRESVYLYDNGYFIKGQDTAQYAPGIYYTGHNYHKTQNLSARLHISHEEKNAINNLDVSWENSQIWSNRLGKTIESPIILSDRIVYNHYDQRNTAEIKLNRTQNFNKFQTGAGLNILLSNAYKTQINGGFFINYHPAHWTHYINISSANRLPTYTDLYYQGIANIGNPDLQPETAITYEAGSKFFKQNTFLSLSIFSRDARHTIDWIKYDINDKWQAQNLTHLTTYGMEINFMKKFENKFLQNISVAYAYLNMQKDENTGFYSKYVLDYLKHKIVMDISHRFFFDSKIYWTGIYKNRNGKYLNYIDGQYKSFDYTPYFITHLKWSKPFNNTHIALSIENLFDTEYRDLSYIKMPGRWVMFEISYKIK